MSACVAEFIGERLKAAGVVCRCETCKAERAAAGIAEPPEPQETISSRQMKQNFVKDRIKDAAGDKDDL